MDDIASFPQELKQPLLDYLLGFISANKRSKFSEIIRHRTNHLAVVLEDTFQSHNASAVLRSCDCFGIQQVHMIENRYPYSLNPDIALGSSKWLSIIKHSGTANNTRNCIDKLRRQGYRIVATSPHKNDYTPETLPLDEKTALVFGTELEGLSATILDVADDFVKIPMFGFTESLNISVSVAIFIHSLSNRMHKSEIKWQLTEEEKLDVMLLWSANTVKKSDLIIHDFLKKREKRSD